jgi:hypothetical protein
MKRQNFVGAFGIIFEKLLSSLQLMSDVIFVLWLESKEQ